jgi:type II secretory pathway pseudopilin PulG
MTLLELAVVAVIVGLLGAMAVTRYSTNTIADVDALGFARQVALDCSHARRLAIATGYNHLVRFTLSGSNATQYVLYRRQGATTTAVDEAHIVPTGVTVTTGGVTDLEFTFVGEALASYTVTVQAPDRTSTVTVPQVTGKAFVQ